MMRGIYIPQNIKSMPLSEDARNVLTSLALNEPINLQRPRVEGIVQGQTPSDMHDGVIDGLTAGTADDLSGRNNEAAGAVEDTGFETDAGVELENVRGADEALAEAEEQAVELLSVLSGVDADVPQTSEQDDDVKFLSVEGIDAEEDLDLETFEDVAEDAPRGFMRFFKRAEQLESGSSLKTVVGLKDVRRAFEQQTSRSPYLTTIFLVVVLLLVAAIPPIINLSYIQPTITDNNQKMTMMANFSAQIEAKTNDAKILQNKIKKLENNLGGYALNVKKQVDFDFLTTAFLGALERYDVKILSNQTMIDESLTTKLDEKTSIEGVMMNLELQTRFDVYQNIRHIFMEQMGSVNVIEEKITARPGENELNIKLKMAVVYLREAE